MRHLFAMLFVLPFSAHAATDFIAPGNPASVGQNGSILGAVPEHPVPAPRGALETLGFSLKPANADQAGARLSRDEAKRHIEQAGYSNVIDLIEDGSGIWQGRAMKAEKSVSVRCTGTGAVSDL